MVVLKTPLEYKYILQLGMPPSYNRRSRRSKMAYGSTTPDGTVS